MYNLDWHLKDTGRFLTNRKCTTHSVPWAAWDKLQFFGLTISSAASLIPVAAKTQTRGTAVASGLNAVILGMDCDELKTKINNIIINFN